MSWKDRLQSASFRGVAFKVDSDEMQAGRRTVLHEYPGRDKPSTEDLGRDTREYSMSAYLIGPDFMTARDALLEAIETAGPGELISPWFGAMNVVMQGKQRISHSKTDGGMCTIAFSFVEAGEDDWPTTKTMGTSLLSARSSTLLERAQNAFVSAFNLDGLPEWMSLDTVDKASTLLGDVTNKVGSADSMMGKALSLLQGDLSVLIPPPSTGWMFARRLSAALDVTQASSTTASSLLGLSRRSASASRVASARPTGNWSTTATDKQTADQLSNNLAALVRSNLIVASANAVAAMPESSAPAIITTHPALDSAPSVSAPADIVTYDDLTNTRQTLLDAIDHESERTTDDGVYEALRSLRREVISTINQQQQSAQQLVTRTPDDIEPALVLAARWYDDADRADELIARNNIANPNFVPVAALRTLA